MVRSCDFQTLLSPPENHQPHRNHAIFSPSHPSLSGRDRHSILQIPHFRIIRPGVPSEQAKNFHFLLLLLGSWSSLHRGYPGPHRLSLKNLAGLIPLSHYLCIQQSPHAHQPEVKHPYRHLFFCHHQLLRAAAAAQNGRQTPLHTIVLYCTVLYFPSTYRSWTSCSSQVSRGSWVWVLRCLFCPVWEGLFSAFACGGIVGET